MVSTGLVTWLGAGDTRVCTCGGKNMQCLGAIVCVLQNV